MTENAYIHIPFCKRKCRYCAFISGLNIEYKEQYLQALEKEIKTEYQNEELKTLYIGGGTPSLLDTEDIQKIISFFNFAPDVEITLEVNPETIELNKFKKIRDIGVNRISMGVQTFNNTILETIGRLHNEKTIYKAVKIIKNSGFKNINTDIIYGLPTQTMKNLEQDVKKLLELEIQHISAYGLKIEDGTYFALNLPENLPDDELQAEMYLYLCDILAKNGYNHYEISNFSKEGYESKHNTVYWLNKNYYGFGLNASGFIGNIRYKNSSLIDDYIENPLGYEEKVCLSEMENIENEIFLALRLKKGLNITEFNKKYNIDFESKYKNVIKKYEKFINYNGENISLTKEGILISNEIMSEFIS